MRLRAFLLLAVALACSGSLLAACGEAKEPAAARIKTLELHSLPPDVLGLHVQSEDPTKTVSRTKRSYVDSVALYSLRKDELVQATLQVDELKKSSDYRSAGFRTTLVNGIGGSKATPVRLGDETVYLTRGLRQRIAIWFRGRHVFILSTREEFDKPRTLIRTLLEVKS